jgi:hypothetical protein
MNHAKEKRTMANQKIADAAIAAMNDPSVESKPGYCSRFTRQVVSKVYGEKYRGLFGASAIDTGKNFRRAGLDVNVDAKQLEPGDILFKMRGSGGFGHVGIYVGDRGVAENSSTSLGRVKGAKGFRTLGQWGQFDLVGRIPPSDIPSTGPDAVPPPDKKDLKSPEPLMYNLMLNGQKIADMPVHDGVALCPVRPWASALGFEVDWNEDTHRVMFDGKQIEEPVTLIDERAYLPIRILATAAGLKVLNFDATGHTVTVGR